MFSYCKNPGQAEVCFELSKDNGKLYEVDDEISAVLSIAVTSQAKKLGTIVTETNVEDKTAKLKITDKKFSADKGIYASKATVDENKYNLSMSEKASVDVTASYTTCQYDYVMPKSSITFTDENAGYVYLLQQKKTGFTKKYYVKRYYINVKNYSDADAAVEGPFYYLPVVVSSSKPLSDGMTVKVW